MNYDDYRKTFSGKTTNELVYLQARGGLVDSATAALESVLSERDVSDDDYLHAHIALAAETNDREQMEERVSGHFKFVAIKILIILTVIISIYIYRATSS